MLPGLQAAQGGRGELRREAGRGGGPGCRAARTGPGAAPGRGSRPRSARWRRPGRHPRRSGPAAVRPAGSWSRISGRLRGSAAARCPARAAPRPGPARPGPSARLLPGGRRERGVPADHRVEPAEHVGLGHQPGERGHHPVERLHAPVDEDREVLRPRCRCRPPGIPGRLVHHRADVVPAGPGRAGLPCPRSSCTARRRPPGLPGRCRARPGPALPRSSSSRAAVEIRCSRRFSPSRSRSTAGFLGDIALECNEQRGGRERRRVAEQHQPAAPLG